MRPKLLRAQKILRNGEKAEPGPAEILRARLGRYACEHCGVLWTDTLRDLAVSRGRWVPITLGEVGGAMPRFSLAPEVVGAKRLGFHLPGILSWAVSLSELVASEKQAHVNGFWALPHVAVTVELDEKNILGPGKTATFRLAPCPTGPWCSPAASFHSAVRFYLWVFGPHPSQGRACAALPRHPTRAKGLGPLDPLGFSFSFFRLVIISAALNSPERLEQAAARLRFKACCFFSSVLGII